MRHWRFSGSRPGAWALGRLLRCAVFLGRWTRAVPCPPGAGLSDHVKPEAPSAGPWVTASGCPGLPRAPVGSRAFSGGRGVQAVSPNSQEIPWGHRALHSSGHAGPGPLPAPRWWTCSPRAPCRPRAGPAGCPPFSDACHSDSSAKFPVLCGTPAPQRPGCQLRSATLPPATSLALPPPVKLGSEPQVASRSPMRPGAVGQDLLLLEGGRVFRDSETEVETLGHRPRSACSAGSRGALRGLPSPASEKVFIFLLRSLGGWPASCCLPEA